MADDNPNWGYTRIRGALNNIGYDVGRTTIKRILAEHGLEPAPERGRQIRWSTWLRAHWGAIAGMDFFTVEVLDFRGLNCRCGCTTGGALDEAGREKSP